ncbi:MULTISPECIES: transposase [unclassified Streptomyces]|uniref:transposase n=1 Tax=unclassified Streptomyces TaxID=2593676 RepID=UPI002B1DFB8D|nr:MULTISPECIES: transposase [unclassified Streptomyces]
MNRTCGAPGARKRARRVREAVRGNGLVDEARTAPRIDFTVHKAAGLREFAASRDWLTIYYLPPYAPDLNPVEGIWSLLRRGWLSNVAFSTPEHLVQRIRRGLRHIQYRSHLVDGCLAETGLTISPA